MPFRDRLHNAAVRGCLIAAISFLSACEGYAQDNAATPAQQPQQQETAPPQPSRIQEQVAEPEYYKADCERPKDHDAADLCEQRRMAKAAEDAVWWSRLQTWLGGIGFIAVIGTLIFSGIAAKAASRSASAAERALTDLERPFVYVEITNNGFSVLADGRLEPAGKLIFQCVNLGRTPADLHDLRDEIVEIDKGNWPDPIIPTQEPRSLPPGTVSAADKPYVFNIDLVHRIGPVTRGRVGLDINFFLMGYVRYADVFGHKHLTGFCAIYDPVSWGFVLRGDDRYNYSRKET